MLRKHGGTSFPKRAAAVTVAAVATAAVFTAAPASAARGQCVAASDGHKVVVESTRGLVFRKSGRLRGCSYANGRVSVLPAQGPMEMSGYGKGVAKIGRASCRERV